jgi:HEAT repeat protein
VDKNYDILCYLREYQIPDSIDKIAHFLKDPDERVRFAAAELLIAQKSDAIKAKISKFLKDDSSENRRLRQAVIQVYVDRSWPVDNPEQFGDGHVADGVRVNAHGMLEIRA